MMNVKIAPALIACCIVAAGCGKARPAASPAPLKNEPNGFGGIAWGTEASLLPPGMEEDRMSGFMQQTAGIRLFRKAKEDVDLGGATPSKVQYGFYKGRFYLAMVEFRGGADFDKIAGVLGERHGPGLRVEEGKAVSWIGRKVDILLLRKGVLICVYKPISEEKERDDGEKAERLIKG